MYGNCLKATFFTFFGTLATIFLLAKLAAFGHKYHQDRPRKYGSLVKNKVINMSPFPSKIDTTCLKATFFTFFSTLATIS